MANEAKIIELYNGGKPIRFTCLDNTTIEKGTLLELEDTRTVKKVSGSDIPIAGIASAEKVADDGATSIAVYQDGMFEMTATGSVTVGYDVVSAGADNTIKNYTTLDGEKGRILGKALNTGTTGDTIRVRVNL